ncbi:MAG: hypothetical protein GIX03_05805 [Candidatus Eremiobacteraeota bacterium]|nr:hypothetical protein [Candidatus Eremiobacteraeota bacterium]MBC5820536.1 hypothetical protein [Candidatus Eremiobacteraeota bacterium]
MFPVAALMNYDAFLRRVVFFAVDFFRPLPALRPPVFLRVPVERFAVLFLRPAVVDFLRPPVDFLRPPVDLRVVFLAVVFLRPPVDFLADDLRAPVAFLRPLLALRAPVVPELFRVPLLRRRRETPPDSDSAEPLASLSSIISSFNSSSSSITGRS